MRGGVARYCFQSSLTVWRWLRAHRHELACFHPLARSKAQDRDGLDRREPALEANVLAVAEHEPAARDIRGRGACDQRAAVFLAARLKSCCDVDRVADDGHFRGLARAHAADHDLAGVYAGAHRERRQVPLGGAAVEFPRRLPPGRLQQETGAYGLAGMLAAEGARRLER